MENIGVSVAKLPLLCLEQQVSNMILIVYPSQNGKVAVTEPGVSVACMLPSSL